MWEIETDGFERIPADGPAIVCANHLSFLDSALLLFTSPRPIAFLGKAEYMKSWPSRLLFPALGMIPVERSSRSGSRTALAAAADVLRAGGLVGVFPEGTRSRDGRLGRGRTGAARLALSVGCPIVPVGIVGTDVLQPPGARVPRLGGACRISVGDPIHHDRATPGRARPGSADARRLTDEVMSRIQGLSGQEAALGYHPIGVDVAEDVSAAHGGLVTA